MKSSPGTDDREDELKHICPDAHCFFTDEDGLMGHGHPVEGSLQHLCLPVQGFSFLLLALAVDRILPQDGRCIQSDLCFGWGAGRF